MSGGDLSYPEDIAINLMNCCILYINGTDVSPEAK